MNPDPSIPPDFCALLACLRGAIRDRPADPGLASAAWPAVFRQARQQGVDAFLYPWLASRLPEPFAAPDAAEGVPAAWRARFLEVVANTLARQRQQAEILRAFGAAQVPAAVLKGGWLSETVYGDPALRTMSDLDLLVRAESRDAAHACMLALGYIPRADTLHSAFAYDQTYLRPDTRLPVELHWHVAAEQGGEGAAPDIGAIWAHAEPVTWSGLALQALAPADQLAHLVQHQLHHLFAMPLRGYVDLALLLRAHAAALTPQALAAAGARWKTGRAIPFALWLASDLLAVPLPEPLRAFAPPPDPLRVAQACRALFDLPSARERAAETTLLSFKHASPAGRVRLVAERIFMPQAFLALRYPCARHAAGLPLAWALRARDLWRQHRAKLAALRDDDTRGAQLLAQADERAALTAWLRTP